MAIMALEVARHQRFARRSKTGSFIGQPPFSRRGPGRCFSSQLTGHQADRRKKRPGRTPSVFCQSFLKAVLNTRKNAIIQPGGGGLLSRAFGNEQSDGSSEVGILGKNRPEEVDDEIEQEIAEAAEICSLFTPLPPIPWPHSERDPALVPPDTRDPRPRNAKWRRHHTCAFQSPRSAKNWSQAGKPAETFTHRRRINMPCSAPNAHHKSDDKTARYTLSG
jgi:hypothetical protein